MALRGLLRRPLRTFFTAAGVATGIAAIIAIVGLSSGMEKSWARGLKARGTDVVVSGKGSGIMPGLIDMNLTGRIAAYAECERATGVLWQQLSIEDSSMIVVSGREWSGFGWNNLKVTGGRLPQNGEEQAVVLGITAAEMLGKKPGDKIQIELEEFTVVGIVDGGAVVENGSITLALPLLQKAVGYPGKINFVNVQLKPMVTETAARALCRRIESEVPGLRATLASETLASNRSFRMIRAGSWATSLLAITAGIFGVLNTMLMSVFERTQELGLLSALGWRRRQIVFMVMVESIALALAGYVCGVVSGLGMLTGLARSPMLKGVLEPYVGPELLLTSLGIALLVGLACGIYPAWKAANTSPGVALRA